MAVDRKAEALGVSEFLFSLPSQRLLIAYLFFACFTAGVIMRLVYGFGLAEAIAFGGAEGVLLLGLPALFAAVLAASIISHKEFRQTLKYYLFIAFAAAVLAALVFLAGVFAFTRMGWDLTAFVLLGNALIVVVWFAALVIALNVRRVEALLLAFAQSFFNVAFLVLWAKFGTFEASFAVGSPVFAFIKILGASFVLLVAVWALAYVVNAPAKRNFGISTVQATALFFAQWLHGSKGLEEVLASLSERVETFLGVVAFRRKSNGSTKALFVVPYLHCGPFGNLGGSEFPALISQALEKRFGGQALVFHGTVNHDFNPVYSSSVHGVIHALTESVESAKNFEDKASLLSSRAGDSQVDGLAFGDNAFLTLSRAPDSTEDLDLAMGLSLRYKSLSKGFNEALLVDRHNSVTTGRLFEVGSKEYFDYDKAIETLERPRQHFFSLGAAGDDLQEFGLKQGVGGMGLRVAVFDVGGKRSCFILLDGNNVLPGFRALVLNRLKDKGFEFCDVLSTDAHSVNTIGGVHNPLGARCDQEKLVEKIEACVDAAVKDLEPCEASMAVKRIQLSVFGAKRQHELITTINSVISVLKILAPLVLAASVLLAFLLLVFF